MIFISIINLILTIVGLLGIIKKVKYKEWCFYALIFSNVIFALTGLYHLTQSVFSILMLAYLGVCLWGIIKWESLKRGE